MIINTDHLDRCVRTLESSLDLYRQAQPGSIDQEVSHYFMSSPRKPASSCSSGRSRILVTAGEELDATPVKEILRPALFGLDDPVQAEAVAEELDELPTPYRFDVKAYGSIADGPLREHIARVGVSLYRRDPPDRAESKAAKSA